jgi:DNA-binding MarR family transcriptional regulator
MRSGSEEMVHLLVHLSLSLREHERGCLERLALSHAQARALWALRPGETTTIRALADSIRGDPSNLSTALRGLEERGLVERGESARDRRATALQLTAGGSKARRELVDCLEPPAVAGLDPADRERLLELLREVDRRGRAGS